MGELTSELLQFWGAATFEDQSRKLTKSEKEFLEKEEENPTPLPVIRKAMFKLMMLRAAADFELNQQGLLPGVKREVGCGIRLGFSESSLLHFDNKNNPIYPQTTLRRRRRFIRVKREAVDVYARFLPNSNLYDEIRDAKKSLSGMTVTCHFL